LTQVTGIGATTRGSMPADWKMAAVTPPGRAAMTCWRNCGVSTHALKVLLVRLRRPS
jgi:hypothetical protein